jgi:hypothetical protein
MIETLSTAVGQGGHSYLTARLMDLISGSLKPPASRSDVLSSQELRRCPNYLFYCRFWQFLTEAFPEVQFVRSAGLYRGASDWLKRWPTEKVRYQSLIPITFPSLSFSTGQTVILGPDDTDTDKFRYVGAGVTREVVDMVALGRPVCLIEADDSAIEYRIIDRFTLMPVLRPTRNCAAIVREDPDASPYAPDCGAVDALIQYLKA